MENKQPNYQFADLLTEAIYTIKRKEGKKISVIQDEITFALGRDKGNPLEYWRKGNVPTSQKEFAQLLSSLMRRGDLSRDWLGKIWRCTDFSGFDEFANQLLADRSKLEGLPQQPFATFIGRESLSNKLYHALTNEEGNQLIGIDGMGGIGKTALTHSVVARSLSEGHFDDVIWISDGPQQSFGLTANGQGSTYSLDYMLNTIGSTLGLLTFAELKEKEKIGRIRTLLKSKKMVIILDNLERAVDLDHDALSKLSYLVGLSQPSKF
ncbi:MAG: NB-ARC domain-containing protein, partial [Chloroflexota bacterium]